MPPSTKLQKAPPLIGNSQNLERIRELINHVADTGLNILICGESGVGKEVVAQNLYQASPRNGKPFLKINCAALPDGLLESELFGHEQGAFTGAERKKRGKFELAHGGVLLLDEIGDMSIALQAKLLHVLQSGEFSRLGSEKEIHTDTWVIAATNHELESDIRQEKFREDLFYRLNIIKILIQPLRERPEDLPALIDYFVNKYAYQFQAGRINAPSNPIIAKMCQYHWPGNVRELQNVLKRGFALGNWDEIIDELLSIQQDVAVMTRSVPGSGKFPILGGVMGLDPDAIDLDAISLKEISRSVQNRVEREVISYVLDKSGWNRSKASRILKISYKALLYKIKDMDIQIPT